MPIESFKKIWISCHLLYPNPSQARDIFGLIVENGIDHSSSPYGQVFQGIQKLYRIYKSRDPVKSASANFEFTATPLNYWKRVLLKCTKDETFVLMAVLLDLVSVKDISRISKIPQTKVRYLFNQSVKKVIVSPSLRFDPKKDIKLKEYHTQEITSLFVSEHMIEYVLGISDSLIADKMDEKLKDNNRYNDYRNEILKFKSEVTDLTVSHHFEEVMKVFGNASQLQSLKKVEIKQQKKTLLGLVGLAVAVVGLIVRPDFLKAPVSESTDQKVVLEEIAISKNEAPEEPVVSQPVVIAASSTPAVSAVVVVSAPAQVVAAEKTVIAKNAKPVKEKEPKAEPEDEGVKPVKLVAPTGVYRGTITVTDFDQVISIIKDRIVNVGGRKAGEVELGWIKNKNISYFHFIFPAEKREELVSFIQQYGTLNYKFEQHPRTLPIGQSRFIIEVYKGE